MSDTDWAYLAGFVEADGCISGVMNMKIYPRIRVVIAQRDPRYLRWLHERLGGNFRYQTSRDHPIYFLTYAGENGYVVLQHILEYMHQKQDQAKVALRLHETRDVTLIDELKRLKKVKHA
jgi:hypothetical protein